MSKKYLNWKQISIELSESDNSIRKNTIPKKYRSKINELLTFLDEWKKKDYEVSFWINTPDGYDNRYEKIKANTKEEALAIVKNLNRRGKEFEVVELKIK